MYIQDKYGTDSREQVKRFILRTQNIIKLCYELKYDADRSTIMDYYVIYVELDLFDLSTENKIAKIIKYIAATGKKQYEGNN